MPSFIHAIGKKPNQIYRIYGTWGERPLPGIRSKSELYSLLEKELNLPITSSRKDVVFALMDKSWNGKEWKDDLNIRIKSLREQAKLTQIQAAELTGLSIEGIRAIEQGLRKPSYDSLRRIAIALHVSIEKIINIPKVDQNSETHEIIFS